MTRRPIITTLDGVGDETMLTTHDVGAILHCSSAKASDLLSTGEIPAAVRIGSRLLIAARDLRAHLQAEKLPKGGVVGQLRQQQRDDRRARRQSSGAGGH